MVLIGLGWWLQNISWRRVPNLKHLPLPFHQVCLPHARAVVQICSVVKSVWPACLTVQLTNVNIWRGRAPGPPWSTAPPLAVGGIHFALPNENRWTCSIHQGTSHQSLFKVSSKFKVSANSKAFRLLAETSSSRKASGRTQLAPVLLIMKRLVKIQGCRGGPSKMRGPLLPLLLVNR